MPSLLLLGPFLVYDEPCWNSIIACYQKGLFLVPRTLTWQALNYPGSEGALSFRLPFEVGHVGLSPTKTHMVVGALTK
jgi:hypothetical protein